MKNFMLFILKFIVVLYVLVGILLYIFQRNLLYYPIPKQTYDFKRMTLNYDNEKLNTIVLNEGKKNAIVYFGGNGESVVYNADVFSQRFPNYSIYLVDYRAYGWSSGKPTEENLFKDALFLYDNIKSQHQHINVIGRSLGSGVASYLSSKRAVEKLVLITPFDSLQNVAQKMYPVYPMRFILKDKYNSLKYLASKRSKNILILMAKDDRLIPNKHSWNLANSLPSSELQVKVIENAGHNSISHKKEYYEVLENFMKKNRYNN